MGAGLLWLWRSLITLLWYHLGPAWTAPILMWEGMRWLHFSNKVILSLPVGRQRKNGSLQVPGKHTRWKWTFLHQSTLWWCAAEEQCHAQQSWGAISWVVLQRSMPIRLGRAAQSPGALRTLVTIPHLSIQLSLWLTFMEGLCVLCLLLTEEGTKQECGWRVSAGLGSVGNLGSVVCGSWNIPALRMSEPSQVSLMLRRQAQDAWNLPPGMAYKVRAPSWGLFGGGGVYALWEGGVVSGRWGNKHPPRLSDCEQWERDGCCSKKLTQVGKGK